jgi:hypothetical protein
MRDALLFRGRIERKAGYQKLGTGNSRLRWLIGTTSGAGTLTYTLPDNPITTTISQFSIGTTFFTDSGAAGAPATLLSSGTGAATLNRSTGVLTITGATINASVYYYPGLSVMGLSVLETLTINDELLVGFDTKYSYLYDVASQDFLASNTYKGTSTIFEWTGADYNFFWTVNYANCLWASNGIYGFQSSVVASTASSGDGIRWLDQSGQGWVNFLPPVDSTNYLMGCIAILPYKGRLLVFNTWEGSAYASVKNYQQRARWCEVGTPFYTNTLPTNFTGSYVANAWRSDLVGFGGYIDAPTAEQIIGVEYVKDTVIVFFERSTYQLVYTENATFPFFFQKINTELGTESSFSTVPFDSGVFGIGNYGIITTDSVSVVRVDQKIPDEVFKIQNINQGVDRVHGIRDYTSQLVYWTIPDIGDYSYGVTYPTKVLVYNYVEGSWSEFIDSFTCFGYWQWVNDLYWSLLNQTPQNEWQSMDIVWNSGYQSSKYPNVVAGNQRGFVFVLSQMSDGGDINFNCPCLEISNMSGTTVTVPNHNFFDKQYVYISAATGYTTANGTIYSVDVTSSSTFQLIQSDGITPLGSMSGYTGGGLVTLIPHINIQTKEFNPFYEQGASMTFKTLEVLADNTSNGEIAIKILLDSDTSIDMSSEGPILLPLYPEQNTSFSTPQVRSWHRIFPNAYGSFIQIQITWSDSQLRDVDIVSSDVAIHGLLLYVAPSGRLSYEF